MIARNVLFGGTFDPVHNAHIEIACAAAERFRLEKVLFVPAANPPHKSRGAHASYEDRIRMCELACASEPRFEVSRIEQDSRRSYSILTIEKLLAAGMGPLGFLIGADAFSEIQTWHRWREVVRVVEFIVVTRPGATYVSPEGARIHELGGLYLPVSSSDIRLRLARGDEHIPVPDAVLAYIREHHLYQDPETQSQVL
ncbi:MAG: nicotinate-nucleotide adenylyltransferase [Bryobacteraceae bacterium]